MEQLQTLGCICFFTSLFLAFAWLVCSLGQQQDAARNDGLLYVGVLYVGKNDRGVECYRHTGTNAVYYKFGVQYRNANNGRIVSSAAAVNGTY